MSSWELNSLNVSIIYFNTSFVPVCANLVCVVDQFDVNFGPKNPSNQIQGASFWNLPALPQPLPWRRCNFSHKSRKCLSYTSKLSRLYCIDTQIMAHNFSTFIRGAILNEASRNWLKNNIISCFVLKIYKKLMRKPKGRIFHMGPRL